MEKQLTDDACDRLVARAGCPQDSEHAALAWFIEDLVAAYVASVPRAARALHPSATHRRRRP